MKIVILSDIHGNDDALEAVLNHAKKLSIDRFFVLGDLIGYYPEPGKVIRRIQALDNKIVIQGNHERLLMQVLNGEKNIEELNNQYGEGHQIALRELDLNELEWLGKLPVEQNVIIDGLSIKLCHGAPGHPDLYLYPDTNQDILAKLFKEEVDFIFVGHSHYPFMVYRNNRVIINVGSVGMSKDVGGMASWGVLDTSNHVYIPYRTPYLMNQTTRESIESNNSNSSYLLSLHIRNRYDHL